MPTKKILPGDGDGLLNNPNVHPDFKRKAKAVLEDVRSKHPELYVFEVYRSQERQRQLYCQGRSLLKLMLQGFRKKEVDAARAAGFLANEKIVTRAKVSKFHSAGRAMDVCWCINGKLTWNVPETWWDMYVHAGEVHGLKSLRPMESAHLQLEL